MRVEILDVAQDEASDAAVYYELEVPGLGYDYLAEFDRAVVAIGEQPETWPRLRVVRQRTVRRFLLSRFPSWFSLMAPDGDSPGFGSRNPGQSPVQGQSPVHVEVPGPHSPELRLNHDPASRTRSSTC